jgi:hypothetical protein
MKARYWLIMGESEEVARLLQGFSHIGQVSVKRNEVEQVSMFARGRIHPLACPSRGILRKASSYIGCRQTVVLSA